MSKENMQNEIATAICKKEENISCEECFKRGGKEVCKGLDKCRISEKTEDQLKYVLSPIDENTFLRACAGSGKTEVVGMKAAYEISKWDKSTHNGIAILTFTNDAKDVIKERISQFNNMPSTYPHFVGTLSSFIHQYISQPFGYKYRNFHGKNGDCSFLVVDKTLDSYKSCWLDNYYSFKIYAHKTFYDYEKERFYINKKFIDVSEDEHLNSGSYKKYIERINKSEDKKKEYTIDDVKKSIITMKRKFNSHGFANFDDMNNIAYKVLFTSNKTREVIAKKFPLIIIDECQDLSWIELKILENLMVAGSKVHFVGDLNQSVYEFKRVDPVNTREFVKCFDSLNLNENFRCCGPIVTFTNKLVPDCNDIKTGCEDKLKENALLYMAYEKEREKELIEKYRAILKEFNIKEETSCIIAKQNSMVDKLLDQEASPSLLISALQLWNFKDAFQKKKALEYAGQHISRWFGGRRTSKNYSCPKDIVSAYKWRIFLKDVLNDCRSKEELINFKKNYSKWHKQAKELLPDIVRNRYNIRLKEFDDNKNRDFNDVFDGNWFNSPSGLGNREINILIPNDSGSNIPVKTVHGSKGCTYDSTMVVSSKNKGSDLGHWKDHWLDGDDEGKRVGYVASTRARYLLVWAVPSPTDEEIETLKQLGLKDAELVKKA